MTNLINLLSKYVNPTVLKNSGWLIIDKVVAAAISFAVYFVMANYLGPEKLGIYNYALSTVAIFATFATLGLDSLIVKDFVQNRYPGRNILGSVFILRLLGSILVTIVTIVVASVSKHSILISLLTGILSSVYIFRSFQVLDCWFLAQKNVKPSVISRNIGALLAAILKIFCVIFKLDLVYITIATSLEFIINVIFLISIYRIKYKQELRDWKFDSGYIRYLLSKGWIITLGVVFSAFASRFDQYLLGTVHGDYSVGIYSPAAKISEFWYYVPMAFLDSVYPTLIEAKKKTNEIFEIKLKNVSMILFYVSLVFCILISLSSELIVEVFLKKEFIEAANILRIYVWGTLGTVMTSFLLRWLIIEEKQQQLVIASFTNFLINVALNLILIPKFDIRGAAWATAISYNLGWILVCVIFNRRTLNRIILDSIILPFKLINKKINSKS